MNEKKMNIFSNWYLFLGLSGDHLMNWKLLLKNFIFPINAEILESLWFFF